jgi:hypothetical protein
MSGHTVGRKRKWPWAVLSVLFALAFAWSFAAGAEVGGVWSVLWIGSAVGTGLCLLRLVFVSISSSRLRDAQEDDGRRAEGDQEAEAEAEGQPSGEQPSAEERARTYEEVFALQADPDAEDLPPAPGDGAGQGGERTEIAPDGQPSSEQPVEPVSGSPDEGPHVDGDVEQDETLAADGASEDHLRRMREEFRARAEEAALRVKQREAELHAPASVADQER